MVTLTDSRLAWGSMQWLISSLVLTYSFLCYKYLASSAGAIFIIGSPLSWVKVYSLHVGHQNSPDSPIFALVAFCTGYSSWCIWIKWPLVSRLIHHNCQCIFIAAKIHSVLVKEIMCEFKSSWQGSTVSEMLAVQQLSFYVNLFYHTVSRWLTHIVFTTYHFNFAMSHWNRKCVLLISIRFSLLKPGEYVNSMQQFTA